MHPKLCTSEYYSRTTDLIVEEITHQCYPLEFTTQHKLQFKRIFPSRLFSLSGQQPPTVDALQSVRQLINYIFGMNIWIISLIHGVVSYRLV